MRSPVEKPHFFKPILPGYKNGITIPGLFFKSLNGMQCEHAVLIRGRRKWLVKINGNHFEDGWTKFGEDNGLQVGDFVVFKHKGDMVFKAMVFDASQCEKLHVQDIRTERSEKQANITLCSASVAHPYFLSTVKRISPKWGYFYIPLEFARSNGLDKHPCEVALLNSSERSWTVQLVPEATRVLFRHGWREFVVANGLKEGSAFKIELIQNGDKPIMKFHGIKSVDEGKRQFHKEKKFAENIKPTKRPSSSQAAENFPIMPKKENY